MKSGIVILSAGVAAAAVITLASALTLGSRRAQATPAFAQQTKLRCSACHVGSPNRNNLTPTGQKFKNNGRSR